MQLVAVTVTDSLDADLQHAWAPGAERTFCGLTVLSSHRVFARFPANKGSLCRSCVEIAILPTTIAILPELGSQRHRARVASLAHGRRNGGSRRR
jgi:hypothetical protein